MHKILFIALLCSFGAQAQIITTICGTGVRGYSGDGGPATTANIGAIYSMGYDRYADLYLAEGEYYRVRKISTAGIITTVAGDGNYLVTGDGGPATAAGLGDYMITTDQWGNIYIGGTTTIRKVTAATGIIATIGGILDSAGYSGDGGAATAAKISSITGIAVDSLQNVYFTMYDTPVIRKISSSGIITTIAGTGVRGFSGDGGAATAAKLYRPYSLTVDVHGNVYYADLGDMYFDAYRIRRVDAATSVITTVAGTGVSGYTGDGGPANVAQIGGIKQLACDASGNIYFGTWTYNTIRKIDAHTGIITTIAGTGTPGFSGDGGPATAAELNNTLGIAIDPRSGSIAFCDERNFRIRYIRDTTTRPPTAVPRRVVQATALSPVIAPNPSASGLFTVRFATLVGQAVKVRVCNVAGAVVKEAEGNTLAPFTFQVDGPPGTYFITLVAGRQTWYNKVVVTGN